MKISEISNKTDKQYFEDFKSSVGTTLRKYGQKALSAMGSKDAKQEALVLEVITQLYQSFAAYSKAAGNTRGTFDGLAGFLRSAGISDASISIAFRKAFAMDSEPKAPPPESAPATGPEKEPVESVVREFTGDDNIPQDKLMPGIELAVRAQYRTDGLRSVVIPEYLGNPSVKTTQLVNKISQEMDKQTQQMDKDGDGQIDNTDGAQDQTDNAQGNPQIDNEKVNAVAQQIFQFSAEEREALTTAIKLKNQAMQKQADAKAKADAEQSPIDTSADVGKAKADTGKKRGDSGTVARTMQKAQQGSGFITGN